MNDEELKAREEAKRERNWNALQRWQVLQETIAWAASQDTVRRNTKEACLAKQARLLAGIEESRQRQQDEAASP